MYVLQTFSGNCALTQCTNLICQASSYCLTELILRLLFKWFNITNLPVQNNLPKHTSRGPGTLLKSRVVTAELDLVHLFSFILLQFV